MIVTYVIYVPSIVDNSDLSLIVKNHYTYPPEGNYKPLEVKNRYGDKAYNKPRVPKKPNQVPSNEDVAAAERTYALIISGGIRPVSNNERYWNDCSFIYQTLVNTYAIPKSNIFTFMSDGTDPAPDMIRTDGSIISQPLDLDFDGEDDIQYAAKESNIKSVLNTLTSRLKKDDHLFIYVIDHGGRNSDGSYICLWDGDRIYDWQLAQMLTPFTDKLVNVNVVLGQCHSGGFVPYLNKLGCVVASACEAEEFSYGCTDVPYDEFVYQWTSAINGATPAGQSVVADFDGNGRVTMEETFLYASENDRLNNYEHPQYSSTPLSIGEDLAFNHLVPGVDLYIKDGYDDTGKEPNLITEKPWRSPSIWVRNSEDGIEEHENPYYDKTHLCSIVYIKVHNRGKEAYKGGDKWVIVYWAQASTHITEKMWKGRQVNSKGQVMGQPIVTMDAIPAIAPGDSAIMQVTWPLPKNLLGTVEDNDTEKHHFCLYAKIMDQPYDDGFVSTQQYFHLRESNNEAQKNVSIISGIDLEKGTTVYVGTPEDMSGSYTLELVPATAFDGRLMSKAKVEMKMSPLIYSAWAKGGFQATNIETIHANAPECVRFKANGAKLENLKLDKNEFDKVALKFNFTSCDFLSTTYTYDLIQRDENGNIIGGETFVIKAPQFVDIPIDIIGTPIGDRRFSLSVNNPEFQSIRWQDKSGEDIGEGNEITVLPTCDNNVYGVVALTDDGRMATGSVTIDEVQGIRSISPSTCVGDELTVELMQEAPANAVVTVSSVADGVAPISCPVARGDKSVKINASTLRSGVHAVALSVDDEIIDSKKFVKQ